MRVLFSESGIYDLKPEIARRFGLEQASEDEICVHAGLIELYLSGEQLSNYESLSVEEFPDFFKDDWAISSDESGVSVRLKPEQIVEREFTRCLAEGIDMPIARIRELQGIFAIKPVFVRPMPAPAPERPVESYEHLAALEGFEESAPRDNTWAHVTFEDDMESIRGK